MSVENPSVVFVEVACPSCCGRRWLSPGTRPPVCNETTLGGYCAHQMRPTGRREVEYPDGTREVTE